MKIYGTLAVICFLAVAALLLPLSALAQPESLRFHPLFGRKIVYCGGISADRLQVFIEQNGKTVKTVTLAENGWFWADLKPGYYTIAAENTNLDSCVVFYDIKPSCNQNVFKKTKKYYPKGASVTVKIKRSCPVFVTFHYLPPDGRLERKLTTIEHIKKEARLLVVASFSI